MCGVSPENQFETPPKSLSVVSNPNKFAGEKFQTSVA